MGRKEVVMHVVTTRNVHHSIETDGYRISFTEGNAQVVIEDNTLSLPKKVLFPVEMFFKMANALQDKVFPNGTE